MSTKAQHHNKTFCTQSIKHFAYIYSRKHDFFSTNKICSHSSPENIVQYMITTHRKQDIYIEGYWTTPDSSFTFENTVRQTETEKIRGEPTKTLLFAYYNTDIIISKHST